ncbi:hypothetical protein BDR26DRAFT_476108 [Obelidium mucronatum]|nr:hypothetical protein BDR26DRAFT_476108 [Obelidium mucronatum]
MNENGLLLLTSELEAAKAQILALSEFESLLTQKLQALELEGASKAEEVLRLQTRCVDLESIQTQLKRAEEELENLRSQLREHSSLSDSFKEKLVLAAERESNLTTQLNESNSKLDSMKELVDSSGIEIQRLRDECLSLSEAAALVGSVVLEVEGLKSELEQKTKEISQHEETFAELETIKVALNSSLQASVAEVARLSTLNTELENSCLSHMSRMTALEQELSAKSKALSTIEERLSSALLEKDALIESLKESAKLTTRYEYSSKEIESKLREAESVIESMTSKVAVLEEELGIARQKSDTVSEGLRSELTELQASLDSMRSKLEESTNMAVEYEKRAQENEERNQILQDSSIALTRENKKLLVVSRNWRETLKSFKDSWKLLQQRMLLLEPRIQKQHQPDLSVKVCLALQILPK